MGKGREAVEQTWNSMVDETRERMKENQEKGQAFIRVGVKGITDEVVN